MPLRSLPSHSEVIKHALRHNRLRYTIIPLSLVRNVILYFPWLIPARALDTGTKSPCSLMERSYRAYPIFDESAWFDPTIVKYVAGV
jgi:hypothetical protein